MLNLNFNMVDIAIFGKHAGVYRGRR